MKLRNKVTKLGGYVPSAIQFPSSSRNNTKSCHCRCREKALKDILLFLADRHPNIVELMGEAELFFKNGNTEKGNQSLKLIAAYIYEEINPD